MANEAHEEIIRMAAGTRVDEPIGFPAYGVSVDNNTGQWVELPDVGRFVAPNTSRQISLNGNQGAKAKFNAPPGKAQPGAVAGEECILVFTSERLQTTGAQIPNVLSAAVTLGPEVRAFSSVDLAIGTGAFTALALDSERFDTDSMHDNVVNNSRITFNTAGKYLIGGHVSWQVAGGGTFRIVEIDVNGVLATRIAALEQTPLGALRTIQGLSTLWDFIVGDFAQLVVAHDAGVNINVLGTDQRFGAEFWAVRVA